MKYLKKILTSPFFWYAIFLGCLVFRFTYVFYTNPMDHIFSDPGRHWENGRFLLTPRYFSSVDLIGYQIYVWLVYLLTEGEHNGVAVMTGLLSALMPFFWYKALREIIPFGWAITGGIIIALMPSLTMIYSYYMNETLLLTLLALSSWLTLSMLKKPSKLLFFAMAVAWMFACYTRITAIPLMAVAMLFVLMQPQPWSKRFGKTAVLGVLFTIMLIPACHLSRIHLNFCAPFGSPYMNMAYRAAHAKVIKFQVKGGGGFGFSSPSFGSRPFEPLSDWRRPEKGTWTMSINPARGRQSWVDEVERSKRANMDKMSWWEDFKVNALLLFFDKSWPDDNHDYTLGWLSYENRWLWFPLTCAVFVLGLFYMRIPRRRSDIRPYYFIPICAGGLLVGLLFQQSGMMEGRYRKSLEPFLLASFVVLLYQGKQVRKHQKEGGSSETQT